MSYVTLETLKGRFGEQLLIRLTDDESVGVIDGTKISKAIAAIEGFIDSYLRQIYTLPISEVPPELAAAAEDLVIDRLYSGKPERDNPPDVKKRAAEVKTWLSDIKKGLATLSIATLPPAPGTKSETGGAFVRTSKKKSDRIFSDEKLDSFTR